MTLWFIVREGTLFTEGYREMKLKAVSGIMLTLLLIGILTLVFNIRLVKSEATTIIVPDEYEKIQWAIGNASAGDTIFVRAGTYYEHVAINKSISLIGESKYNTILDGNGTGTVIDITANNVTISGFTIQNSAKPELHGIRVYCSSGINISGNIITNNGHGIYTGGSYYTPNFITSNIISNNWRGICLSNYGYTVLTNNTISHNIRGITLYAWMGVLPRIFHNNFINNGIQGYCVVAYALWDDGYPSGGNYWSDYTGKDEKNGPNQDQLGSDGIGDTPYVFDYGNIDNYPLMYTGPFHQLTATSSPITGIKFTINGAPKTTPYTEWLLEGSYTLVMPQTHDGYVWSHWLEDGDPNRIKTILLQGTTWTAVYEPTPKPVGGKATPISIPLNKPETPTLWVWLTTIILPLLSIVVYVKLRKKKQ